MWKVAEFAKLVGVLMFYVTAPRKWRQVNPWQNTRKPAHLLRKSVYKNWSYLTWLINILGSMITPMPTKGLIIWFVNHGFVKTDQPVTRSNGSPRFVKLVENSGWLIAKSFKQLGWATPELTPVDKKGPTPLDETGSRPFRSNSDWMVRLK
jgi:hypothetical protein